MSEFGTIATKAVRHQNIRARSCILGMNPGDNLRMAEIHLFRASPRGQASLLEQGSHGAIQDKHPLS